MRSPLRVPAALLVLAVTTLVACGGDDQADGGPSVVVTTGILGDVVRNLVGDAADVVTVMPDGASPHDFQASAQQVDRIRRADALIVNGAGFEEGLLDVLESAEADGVPTHAAIDSVEPVTLPGSDEIDPHFFVDPARMADAAEGIVDFLAEAVPSLDTAALRDRAAEYVASLESLAAEVRQVLAAVPPGRRVLVTNHEVFGYFADRYDFEVVGTVIPGGATGDAVSAADLTALASVIEEREVPAIFADTSSPDDLARTLAGEVGRVEVVELFSESLGPAGSGGETYEAMVRTNAERIADALRDAPVP